MITVYKYPVKMEEDFSVRMPAGATVVHVGMQDGEPQMWCRVDTDQPERSQLFGVFGTGHNMSKHPVSCAPHLGTFFIGSLVFHLFGGIYG